MNNFKLNMNASASGTSFHGQTISVKPKDLIAIFGSSFESDGYKVTCEWFFEDDEGNVFTLYDYKESSLYDKGLPSPDELKNQVIEFHIGYADRAMRDVAEELIIWLKFRLDKKPKCPTHIKDIVPEVIANIEKRALISALERIILTIGDENLVREARLNNVLVLARDAIKAVRGES